MSRFRGFGSLKKGFKLFAGTRESVVNTTRRVIKPVLVVAAAGVVVDNALLFSNATQYVRSHEPWGEDVFEALAPDVTEPPPLKKQKPIPLGWFSSKKVEETQENKLDLTKEEPVSQGLALIMVGIYEPRPKSGGPGHALIQGMELADARDFFVSDKEKRTIAIKPNPSAVDIKGRTFSVDVWPGGEKLAAADKIGRAMQSIITHGGGETRRDIKKTIEEEEDRSPDAIFFLMANFHEAYQVAQKMREGFESGKLKYQLMTKFNLYKMLGISKADATNCSMSVQDFLKLVGYPLPESYIPFPWGVSPVGIESLLVSLRTPELHNLYAGVQDAQEDIKTIMIKVSDVQLRHEAEASSIPKL